MEDIEYFELNEAFSVVGLANIKLLGIDARGPTSMEALFPQASSGLCSGARILVSLIHVLRQQNARLGAAGICNGGGGASAMVLERN